MTRFVYVLPAGRFRWKVRVPTWGPIVRPDELRQLLGTVRRSMEPNDNRTHVEQLIHTQLSNRRQADNGPVSLFYRRKAHALIAARAIAILIGGEVQPHDRRGRIQDPDSYGNDPRETKG